MMLLFKQNYRARISPSIAHQTTKAGSGNKAYNTSISSRPPNPSIKATTTLKAETTYKTAIRNKNQKHREQHKTLKQHQEANHKPKVPCSRPEHVQNSKSQKNTSHQPNYSLKDQKLKLKLNILKTKNILYQDAVLRFWEVPPKALCMRSLFTSRIFRPPRKQRSCFLMSKTQGYCELLQGFVKLLSYCTVV